MVWLQGRHQEHEVFGRIVTYVEETLIQAGRGERRGQLPAIAFIDLTGYTEMTASAGDEHAAESATMLQVLAESAVRRADRSSASWSSDPMRKVPPEIQTIAFCGGAVGAGVS